MKLLHLGDLHLGKALNDFVLISGDAYDILFQLM